MSLKVLAMRQANAPFLVIALPIRLVPFFFSPPPDDRLCFVSAPSSPLEQGEEGHNGEREPEPPALQETYRRVTFLRNCGAPCMTKALMVDASFNENFFFEKIFRPDRIATPETVFGVAI